jgi:hypothetical protein
MITNERQYRITKAEAERFEQALTRGWYGVRSRGRYALLVMGPWAYRAASSATGNRSLDYDRTRVTGGHPGQALEAAIFLLFNGIRPGSG